MEFHLTVFLLLFLAVFGEACVTFNFEEGFDSFDPTLGTVCASVNNNWSLRQYSSSDLLTDPPHPLSETFITSVAPRSCVSSFLFDVENGGVVEVSVYMRFSDFMTIGIHNEAGQQIATWTTISNPIPANQWTTVRLTVSTVNNELVRGYLSLFASVTEDEAILVDAFRYIPLNQDPDDIECAIYTDEENVGTEAQTTESESSTTENESSTTESVSTTEASTTENESSTTESVSTTEASTTENESSTTESVSTTEASTTENESSTTESVSTTEASTTENESSTTESVSTTEASTTENESSTTESVSTTEASTTDNESSTTESVSTTEASTTDNESSTTESVSTTEASTTENESSTTESVSTTEASTTENESSTTDNYSTTESTTITTTETNSEETTDIPDYKEEEFSFWTPLTIALIATASFLVLLLIIYVSYWCGKRKEKKKIPEILYLDIEELPKPVIVPRVKRVYTDSMRINNPYANDYL